MTARWTPEQAWDWYRRYPWLVGCNFTPSTAINQLEFWQPETFDPATIDRELGWASQIGFNTARVYLHDLLWLHDEAGFKQRINQFLDIAVKNDITPLFCIFDDCWRKEFSYGVQPAPLPSVHNSGWVQSPGAAIVRDPSQWARLEDYVKGLLTTFGQDERILLWDLYNEPGNNDLGSESLPLLTQTFAWAQAANPSQPLTVGVWFDNAELNALQLAESDIVTFHNYNDAVDLEKQIQQLALHGRPMICTEYMARTRDSRFETHLPIFKKHNVGAINWGLVAGKTQTHFAWGEPVDGPEPALWFHEVFRPDGTPYRAEETDAIRSLTGRGK